MAKKDDYSFVPNMHKAVLHCKFGLFYDRVVASRTLLPFSGSLTSLLLMDPW